MSNDVMVLQSVKSPLFWLLLVTRTIIISSCQSQPNAGLATSPAEISTSASLVNETTKPVIISPKGCASSNGPLPSLSNPELPPAKRLVNSSLGGGVVQSKEFTIELLLYCDPVFQPNASETYFRSDIGGLAIYYNWRFDANVRNEKTFSYFGMEPDVILRLVSYTQGYVQGQSIGVKFTSKTLPDFSKNSSPRFVYIASGPSGQFAGAALSFDLPQVPDGLEPDNILVTPLSDTELQSIKGVLPTVVP